MKNLAFYGVAASLLLAGCATQPEPTYEMVGGKAIIPAMQDGGDNSRGSEPGISRDSGEQGTGSPTWGLAFTHRGGVPVYGYSFPPSKSKKGRRDPGALQDQGGVEFGPGYFPGRNTGGWYSTPNGQNRSKSTNPGTANPGWGGGNGND